MTEQRPLAVLIGPPGSGKSTVGAALAHRLDRPFADADTEVEQAAGKAIADVFTEDGEPAFRVLEEKVIAEGLGAHTGVYALGGGAVLSETTRQLLTAHTVVFLSVGMAIGVQRTGLSTARPLLTGVNPRSSFKKMLDDRLPLYREVATVEVETDDRSPNEVVDAVITELEHR